MKQKNKKKEPHIILEISVPVLVVVGTALQYCLKNTEKYAVSTPNGEDNIQTINELLLEVTEILMSAMDSSSEGDKTIN